MPVHTIKPTRVVDLDDTPINPIALQMLADIDKFDKIKNKTKKHKRKLVNKLLKQVCKVKMLEKCVCSGKGRPPSGSCK
jgi:hypothetical protein